MIRCSSGISVVLGDTQIGPVGVMMQPIEDVGGLAHRCRDDPRVKRPVSA